MPNVPRIPTDKFDVFLTNNVEILLLIHPGEKVAVNKNVNESGKELL